VQGFLGVTLVVTLWAATTAETKTDGTFQGFSVQTHIDRTQV